jgi:hypothetical protein
MGRRSIMADKKIETEEVVLGPMVMKPSFDFKKAIAKAKKNAVDCGIFAYIADKKKKK